MSDTASTSLCGEGSDGWEMVGIEVGGMEG